MKDTNIYYVDCDYIGKTVKSFLKEKLLISQRNIIRIKNTDTIKLNGIRCHMNVLLKEGDMIEIKLMEERSDNILPEQMDLDIVFEDEYLIVLNKPANMPVHPTKRHYIGTLANGLIYYWMDREKSIKIRPVNRLDKDTSGLVVFAKSSHVQHLLSMNTGKPEFEKEYIAIVHGNKIENEGTIDAPIIRGSYESIKRVVKTDGERAVTHFKVVEYFKDYSMINLKLETGRTHQIRVHMSHIGHPLVGDDMYGGKKELINRHALHAYSIRMKHPISMSWLEFFAPTPTDIQQLIKLIKER